MNIEGCRGTSDMIYQVETTKTDAGIAEVTANHREGTDVGMIISR